MTKITGGCLCGSVRYAASEKSVATRACWCKLCQKLASGNATINLVFNAKSITISGDLHDYPSVADSGCKMHRRFCLTCGVHLFSEAEERPEAIIIRAGTLDDATQVTVESLIWTSEAPDWALLDPNIPHFDGQPPKPK